jgi:cyclic pyranopterin phosphate synthase
MNKGQARMISVSDKPATHRVAIAEASLLLTPEALRALQEGDLPKGKPYLVSEIAGIQGAKRTPELLPLCHPLPLSGIEVRVHLEPERSRIHIQAQVETTASTGVEMEALTACAIAALNAYDMLKGVSKGLEISELRLLHKSGGRSGTWERQDVLESKSVLGPARRSSVNRVRSGRKQP